MNGLDLLAGACYTKEVVEAARKGYAIGIFAEAFGDAYKTVDAALAAGCKLVRVQLLWSDTHSFGDRDIPKMRKLASQYNQLANKYPNVDVRLSPFCEHNLGNPNKYLDICQMAAPNCLIVNTPYKGSVSSKYINEIHGDHAKPNGRYQYSFDGTECTNSDVESYKKKHGDAEVFFMWSCRFNLRYREKDTTPRPQRIKEARDRKPTNELIDSISYLFTDKGNYNLPKNWLVKSHAEKHEKNDFKGDKLLIISPIKTDFVLLKSKGQVVAKLGYFGVFDGGGYRYYWNKFGYQAGTNLDVVVGNKKYGTINAGFRSAPFR